MGRKQTEPYISTYLHSRGGKLGLPIAGNFELTARCNFDCPMCYVHLKKSDADAMGRELTAQQWIALAKDAAEHGMMFALLTGGEPFVRQDFFEIYRAIKAMGVMVSINSNGSMLDGEIRRQLVEDPPFRMNISLYGGCGETYRNMCGQDAFRRVLKHIRALREAGIQVRLNVSITPYNRQDIRKIYELAEQLDIPVKAASYMFPSIRVNGSRFGQCSRLSPEDAAACAVQWDRLRFTKEEFCQRAENMRALTGERECGADLHEGVGCRAGSSSFWMTWDGRMLPCGMMPGPTAYPLETGFEPAWQHIRRETAAIRLPRECAACPDRAACAVCAAACVTETGAFDKVPRYVCSQTEHTLRKTWEAYQEMIAHEA